MKAANLLVLASLAALGCARAPQKPEPAQAEPAVDAAVTPPPPATSAEPIASAAPASLGPVSGAAPRAEHERTVWALVSGDQPASALPEVGTDPGKQLDLSQRDTLAPRSGGLAGLASVTVGGVVAPDTIPGAARVIAGMRAGFRSCYNRGLADSSAAKGTLKLQIHVAADGSVESVDARVDGNIPAGIVNCIKARVSAAQFDAPNAAAVIKVPVQLTLQE